MTYQLSVPLWLLAGWFVYVIIWTYIVAHTRGYWRGRREGYERCDAGWRQSLAEIVGGATVNEGDGEAKG